MPTQCRSARPQPPPRRHNSLPLPANWGTRPAGVDHGSVVQTTKVKDRRTQRMCCVREFQRKRASGSTAKDSPASCQPGSPAQKLLRAPDRTPVPAAERPADTGPSEPMLSECVSFSGVCSRLRPCSYPSPQQCINDGSVFLHPAR